MINLPPELLQLIFSYLNDKDILAVTETCKRFREIVDSSDHLTKKLTLYVAYPSSNIGPFINMTKRSRRRYRNLCITRSRLRSGKNMINWLSQAFRFVGSSVTNLSIDWCSQRSLDLVRTLELNAAARRRNRVIFHHLNQNFQPNQMVPPYNEELRDELLREFIAVIKQFNCVQKMRWKNVHLEWLYVMNEAETVDFSSLKELEMKHCDAFCFNILSSCTELERFKFSEPYWSSTRAPGIDNFEIFLVSQTALKSLHLKAIQYPRLFQTDRSNLITFRLNHLTLDNVLFKTKTIAENFFKTQNQLKSISIQVQNDRLLNLDELLWYNDILKIVFSENPNLYSVDLEKVKYKMQDLDSLSNIRNHAVQELTFNVSAEDKDAELFKTLVQMFPNLKRITYKSEDNDDSDGDNSFDKSTVLEKVESMTLVNSSVKSLINVFAENLQYFEYSPKLNGQFIDDYIGGFLHRHRTIKHLVIGSKTGRSYFFVSYNLCQLIVNFLTQLKSITIYNFTEINRSVKLLCTLRSLSSLTLSSQQYQQITAKTKVECERMKLKLIPIAINYPPESREYHDN